MTQKSQIEGEVNNFKIIEKKIIDAKEMIIEFQNSFDEELNKLLEDEIKEIELEINKLEINALFAGEFDGNSCFLTINSGAGGTESNDWTEMLLRMYLRWCEKHKFKVEIIDKLPGDDAGIKSVTIRVNGQRAYGWLKNENGVHRLVRISPFDSNAKRHTSFSSVLAYPIIDKNINIVIEDKDLRIDTYRSSGAGGQHVNTTDSAIRITHLPTGIVVASQNQRSQHMNRDEAMTRLKAMLHQREVEAKEKQVTAGQNKTAIEWGHQIRSYVLHPYQMVNDLRTEYKVGNANAVLEGDLDEFMIKNMLRNNVKN